MQINVRKEEGVVILDLDGKLTIGDGDVKLREEVKAQLSEGQKKLILNLKRVSTMDSSGLGELIRCKESARNAEATIKLLHVEDKVQEVLEMTRLIGVFDNFNEETDALHSYRES